MSSAIHLGDPRGKELYLRLVEQTDIVLENFSPRVMPSLGLGWEQLREVNPRLIMVALSAAGATALGDEFHGATLSRRLCDRRRSRLATSWSFAAAPSAPAYPSSTFRKC